MMRGAWILAIGALAASAGCSGTFGGKADIAAIDEELNQAEQSWAALALEPDSGRLLERIIADDFVGMSDSGEVRTKKHEIAYWASQPGNFTSATPAAMTFRHYGGTVIAQGRQTLQPKAGGPPLRIVWTDTWLRRDGRWQVITSQDAVLSPGAGGGDNMG